MQCLCNKFYFGFTLQNVAKNNAVCIPQTLTRFCQNLAARQFVFSWLTEGEMRTLHIQTVGTMYSSSILGGSLVRTVRMD
jgi:hypothetical protein